MGKKKSFNTLKLEAKNVGASCQFTYNNYEDNSSKLKYRCLTCDNEWLAAPSSIQQGKSCPKCGIKKRANSKLANSHTIHELQSAAGKKGGVCLESKYLGINNKHRFVCKKRHDFVATAYAVLNNISWCPICSGRLPPEMGLKVLMQIAESRGGELVSAKYINASIKYKFRCNLGHPFDKSIHKIRAGQWCPTCSDGLYERICRVAVEQFFDSSFQKAYPIWLKTPKGTQLEFDGYDEKLKIAFEHQGIYHIGHKMHWIKSKSINDVKARDKIKRKLSKKHGVRLIEIPELTTTLHIDDLLPFLVSECRKMRINIPSHVLKNNFKFSFGNAYIQNNVILEHQAEIEKRGLRVLSNSYLGSSNNHAYECSVCGFKFNSIFYNIKNGGGCPVCSKVKVREHHLRTGKIKSVRYINNTCKKAQLLPLLEGHEYVNTTTSMPFMCLRCGNIFESKMKYIIKSLRSGLHIGCPECRGISEINENDIFYYVNTDLQYELDEMIEYAKKKMANFCLRCILMSVINTFGNVSGVTMNGEVVGGTLKEEVGALSARIKNQQF